MPHLSDPSPPLRVQVCLDAALDREAYLARISLEPGFTAVQGFVGTNLPDVRLANRCRMDLSAPAVETVVLVQSPTCGRLCDCCPTLSRTVTWPALTQALRKAGGRDDPARSGIGALSGLTRRELEVLRLVGLGKTVNQCAETLGVSPSTIGNHKYRLMRKLGVTTSLQLLRIAVHHGLADLHGPGDYGRAAPESDSHPRGASAQIDDAPTDDEDQLGEVDHMGDHLGGEVVDR